MSVFSRDETNEILAVKNDIKTYVNGTKHLYGWPKNIFHTPEHFYISGGAIASMLNKEVPKDFDVYCRDQKAGDAVRELLTRQYTAQIKDVDEKYREVDCWKIPGKMVTEKSITMNNNMSFIVMHYGEPSEIKATFDFLHCTPHYDIAEDKLYISRAQYDSIKSKTLLVNNPEKVVVHRMQKFVDRGWKTSQEVNALALKNIYAGGNKTLTPAVVNS